MNPEHRHRSAHFAELVRDLLNEIFGSHKEPVHKAGRQGNIQMLSGERRFSEESVWRL
jgi:hypothetical protein